MATDYLGIRKMGHSFTLPLVILSRIMLCCLFIDRLAVVTISYRVIRYCNVNINVDRSRAIGLWSSAVNLVLRIW